MMINKSLNSLSLIFALILIINLTPTTNVCLTQLLGTTNFASNGDFEYQNLGNQSLMVSMPGNVRDWVSVQSQLGKGPIYNSRWGKTQVIQLATNGINAQYNQTLNIAPGQYRLQLQCAARQNFPLSTSGFLIRWNDDIVLDQSIAQDYQIHSYSLNLTASTNINKLTLQATGTLDNQGTSCDNIHIYSILVDYNRVKINGTCPCKSGYYDNYIDPRCVECNVSDALCMQCRGINKNNGSNNNNARNNNSNYQCTKCIQGYYVYATNNTCILCNHALKGCTNCSINGLICYTCNQSQFYFLDTSVSTTPTTCTLCNLIQCTNCTSLYTCIECNNANNYYLNETSKVCEPCKQVGCVNCSSLSKCYQCDIGRNYVMDWESSVCQLCKLEGCAQCSSNVTCERCVDGHRLNVQGICERIKGCGGGKHGAYGYGKDRKHLFASEVEYTDDECYTIQQIDGIVKGIGYASYGVMFLGLVTGKIVGLELFGVLQLAYFNLADNEYVNLYLSPLLDSRYMNGFNFQPDLSKYYSELHEKTVSSNRLLLFNGIDKQIFVPSNIIAIGYTHSFLQNINFMFFLMVALLLFSLILVCLSQKLPIFSKFSTFFLKQMTLTLIIFNTFNISFSFGLHFKYTTLTNTYNYYISAFACLFSILLCIAYMIALLSQQFSNQNLNGYGYGQFKNKFKNSYINRSYIPISIGYRILLGFYMAYGNEEQYQSLIIISASITFLLYFIANLPFEDAYQNYRAGLCHAMQLVILMITNYYASMRANTSLEVKSRIFGPALAEICGIGVCVVVSIVCLAWEMYLWVRGIVHERRRKMVKHNYQNGSQVEMRGTQAEDNIISQTQ